MLGNEVERKYLTYHQWSEDILEININDEEEEEPPTNNNNSLLIIS